jgi:hypothetical protein
MIFFGGLPSGAGTAKVDAKTCLNFLLGTGHEKAPHSGAWDKPVRSYKERVDNTLSREMRGARRRSSQEIYIGQSPLDRHSVIPQSRP